MLTTRWRGRVLRWSDRDQSINLAGSRVRGAHLFPSLLAVGGWVGGASGADASQRSTQTWLWRPCSGWRCRWCPTGSRWWSTVVLAVDFAWIYTVRRVDLRTPAALLRARLVPCWPSMRCSRGQPWSGAARGFCRWPASSRRRHSPLVSTQESSCSHSRRRVTLLVRRQGPGFASAPGAGVVGRGSRTAAGAGRGRSGLPKPEIPARPERRVTWGW